MDRFIVSVLGLNFIWWLFVSVFTLNAGGNVWAALAGVAAVTTGFATVGYYLFSKEWREL